MEFWTNFYAEEPIAAWLCSLYLVGMIALIALVATCIIGALINAARYEARLHCRLKREDCGLRIADLGLKSGAAGNPQSSIRNRRLLLVSLLALAFAGISLLLPGCANLGNGKIDLPYDVAVSLALPNGDALYAATDAQGIHLSGRYISPRTKIEYVLDPSGTLVATDALGNEVRLSPRSSNGQSAIINPQSPID